MAFHDSDGSPIWSVAKTTRLVIFWTPTKMAIKGSHTRRCFFEAEAR